MTKDKICILNLSPAHFKNEQTGEVKDMCKINYIMPCDETENFYGNSIHEGYVPIENLDKLKPYVIAPRHDYIYDKIPLKNGFKMRPIKIAEINLRKS